MWRGNGGWELAASPVVFGAIGWLLDGAVGIRPALTIVGALIGLFGSVFNQYTRYARSMKELAEERAANRVDTYGEGSGKRFGPTEQVDLPSYVVESEIA